MSVFEHPEDFEAAFRAAATAVFPDAQVALARRTVVAVKLRLDLTSGRFVDVFFNARNQRTDLSLIDGDRRVFGYDNLGEWHRHAAGESERHESCPQPTLEAFLREVATLGA